MNGLLQAFSPASRGISVMHYAFDEARQYGAQILQANPTLASAVEKVQEIGQTALENATTNYLAQMEPNEFIDAIVTKSPALAPLGEIAKSNEILAESIQKAFTENPTMHEGFEKLTSGEGGAEFIKSITERMDNPEIQGIVSTALQNVADPNTINFDQFNGLITALKNYDTSDMQTSDQNVVDAMVAVGIDEEKARQALTNVKSIEMQDFGMDFLKVLFTDPQAAAGMMGNFLENTLGLSPEISTMITGFVSLLGQGMHAMPGLVSDFWNNPINDGLRDLTQDGLNRVELEGVQAKVQAAELNM